MASVIAYGRVNGAVRFQYGPKMFHPDWGGAFKLLEVAHIVEKLAVPGHGIHAAGEILENFATSPPQPEVVEAASRINFDKYLLMLELYALDLSYLQITFQDSGLLKGERVSSETVRFGGGGKRPAFLIAEACEELGIEQWGYVRQLALALGQFLDGPVGADGAARAMHAAFTA